VDWEHQGSGLGKYPVVARMGIRDMALAKEILNRVEASGFLVARNKEGLFHDPQKLMFIKLERGKLTASFSVTNPNTEPNEAWAKSLETHAFAMSMDMNQIQSHAKDLGDFPGMTDVASANMFKHMKELYLVSEPLSDGKSTFSGTLSMTDSSKNALAILVTDIAEVYTKAQRDKAESQKLVDEDMKEAQQEALKESDKAAEEELVQ